MKTSQRHLILGFLAAGALMLAIDRLLFESMLVPSSSMVPTFLPNERVFLRKFSYHPLRRFDVIVIRQPQLGHRIVKRVVGLPGECMQLLDSYRVRIGSRELEYRKLGQNFAVERDPATSHEHQIQLKANPKLNFETRHGKEPLCLGPNQFYVLGDNRLASLDSRVFGIVHSGEIEGTMTRIWYSYDKATGRLRTERIGKRVE